MIKARGGQENGRQYLLIGLEDGNIERLKNKQPIFFPLDELGIEGFDVLITYGKDQAEIVSDIQNAQKGDKQA